MAFESCTSPFSAAGFLFLFLKCIRCACSHKLAQKCIPTEIQIRAHGDSVLHVSGTRDIFIPQVSHSHIMLLVANTLLEHPAMYWRWYFPSQMEPYVNLNADRLENEWARGEKEMCVQLLCLDPCLQCDTWDFICSHSNFSPMSQTHSNATAAIHPFAHSVL